MGIIRQRNKNTGKTLVYETYTEIDPETGKKRTKRKYLGAEENGVLIPSSGKRGRKAGQPSQPKPAAPALEMTEAEYEAQIKYLTEEEARLTAQIEALTKQTEALQKAFSGVLALLSDATKDL